jgi:hypothetical protein
MGGDAVIPQFVGFRCSECQGRSIATGICLSGLLVFRLPAVHIPSSCVSRSGTEQGQRGSADEDGKSRVGRVERWQTGLLTRRSARLPASISKPEQKERLMKLLSVILSMVISAGCQLTAPSPASDVADARTLSAEEAVLRTDKDSYAAGEPLRLVLNNTGTDPQGGNLCMSTLQRRDGQQWVDVPNPSDEACTAELLVAFPGAQLSHDFRLRPTLPAGEYRFRTMVENTTTNQTGAVFSNPFQMRG